MIEWHLNIDICLRILIKKTGKECIWISGLFDQVGYIQKAKNDTKTMLLHLLFVIFFKIAFLVCYKTIHVRI